MGNIDDLIGKLAKDGTAVKPALHPVLLSLEWIAIAVCYLAVALMISGIRPDLMARLHDAWFAAEIVSLVAIFIATSLSAALLSFPDLHQMRRFALVPGIMFILFALVMYFSWQADNPPSRPPMHSVECTLSITLLAILPAAWIFYAMRKFASTHPNWAGSIALLSAFSIGALWLRLYEQTDSIRHVVEWHYLPMIAAGFAGLWLGKAILKW
ncbi:MAG TPA: DUF1109 domain-containing protein [Gallionella sp.]|nr:DUF1109 domain-containing protein [Gallionella sp.]